MRESPASAFRRRELLALAALSLVCALAIDLLFYAPTLEDAFITFRYAEHLAEGHGLGAWNRVGERVEGYSTPSWMLVLAAAHALGGSVRTASKALGILAHLALVALFFGAAWTARGRPAPAGITARPDVAVLAGIFCALYLPLCWYASSGMETSAFALLVALLFVAADRPGGGIGVGAAAAALVWTRPEGPLVALAGLAAFALTRRRAGRSAGPVWGAAGALGLALAALLAQRWCVYGELLPNTWWAKAAGAAALPHHARFGLRYLTGFARDHAALLLALALGIGAAFWRRGAGARALRQGAAVSALLLLVHAAYTLAVGGDNHTAFPFWRHAIHVLPPLAALAALGIATPLARHRGLQLLAGLAVVLACDVQLWDAHGGFLPVAVRRGLRDYPRLVDAPHNPYYLWLRDLADPDTRIASAYGGELPYVVDAVHIDLLGLNTRHVARNGRFDPAGPIDSKTDMAWVLEQRPDVIEGYLSGRRLARGIPGRELVRNWRPQMSLGLVTSPIFQSEYAFLANGPYEHLDRALFLHRSYCKGHPRKALLRCVPVAETTLAVFARE